MAETTGILVFTLWYIAIAYNYYVQHFYRVGMKPHKCKCMKKLLSPGSTCTCSSISSAEQPDEPFQDGDEEEKFSDKGKITPELEEKILEIQEKHGVPKPEKVIAQPMPEPRSEAPLPKHEEAQRLPEAELEGTPPTEPLSEPELEEIAQNYVDATETNFPDAEVENPVEIISEAVELDDEYDDMEED